MRAPGFWDGAPSHPAARLLAPLGRLYGGLAARRMDRPGEAAPCPVLCVGNVTLGGAGKTPAALALAAMLRERGARPAFLTRGYGGRLAGPVRVDPDRHAARDTGDEPLLLSRVAATVLSRDRPAGARLCRDLGADVVVMDDGLQNPSLRKDLSLAVVDAGAGIGNGLVFPAGPLRAPLRGQLRHVDGLILVGRGAKGETVAEAAARAGIAVHRARLVPEAGADLSGRRVLAFAGIGRPQKFFDTLREAGAHLAGARAFPDHYPYRPADLRGLDAQARALGADLVTTEKDRVRLPAAFADRVRTLAVTLAFDDAAGIAAQLDALRRAGAWAGPA